MSDQELLEKAIQKAIDGGWDAYAKYEANRFDVTRDGYKYPLVFFQGNEPSHVPFERVIFNHDFAKALWGEDVEETWQERAERQKKNPDGVKIIGSGFVTYKSRGWQYHLQQMVISDDPIKYLGEHL